MIGTAWAGTMGAAKHQDMPVLFYSTIFFGACNGKKQPFVKIFRTPEGLGARSRLPARSVAGRVPLGRSNPQPPLRGFAPETPTRGLTPLDRVTWSPVREAVNPSILQVCGWLLAKSAKTAKILPLKRLHAAAKTTPKMRGNRPKSAIL